jgi:threonyl-tRNA synthetase
LPIWLSPVQVVVIPITNAVEDYASRVKDELDTAGIRVDIDLRSETLNYKIRDAQTKKIPYMVIVGQKEKEKGIVSVRSRAGGDQGQMEIKAFIEKLLKEVTLNPKLQIPNPK